MRGEVNEPIKLTILREGADKPLEFTVVRDIIKVKAVKFRVENDVGYMKITSFTEQTFGDLDDAIKKIEAQVPADKLKGFILDLRNNPGGLAGSGGVRFPTLSSTRAKSSRPAAVIRRTSAAMTPKRATRLRASR